MKERKINVKDNNHVILDKNHAELNNIIK